MMPSAVRGCRSRIGKLKPAVQVGAGGGGREGLLRERRTWERSYEVMKVSWPVVFNAVHELIDVQMRYSNDERT